MDFYLLRSRRPFVIEAARLFGEKVETIEADLNRLTERAEAWVRTKTPEGRPSLRSPRRTGPRDCGWERHADLVDEILRDIERLGMVGESDQPSWWAISP